MASPAEQLAAIDAITAAAFDWVPGEERRDTILPIRHADIWDYRKLMEALHWNAQEVDLSADRADWDRMSADQRWFLKLQLGFFATIDVTVLKNINQNFGEEVDCMEARMAYAAQANMECVHAESYSLQIEAVMTGMEREAVLAAARTMPVIGRMHDWVLRWFCRDHPVGVRLVAFAAVEGVLFSASFAALQWTRELNLLPGITASNAFIVRDEGVHTLLACLLVRKYLRAKPPAATIRDIFGGVVAVLDEFVLESLPVRMIGMNADLMRQYVRFQADTVMIAMGYGPHWGVDNPFSFMDKLALNEFSKENFFESRPTQYQNVSRPGQARLAMDDTPVEY
jgi:ribonucleotide reductase beta subunit family protein with ferritin-like domain